MTIANRHDFLCSLRDWTRVFPLGELVSTTVPISVPSRVEIHAMLVDAGNILHDYVEHAAGHLISSATTRALVETVSSHHIITSSFVQPGVSHSCFKGTVSILFF
jgi:hypothetical protein